jgi:hypothetical protein
MTRRIVLGLVAGAALLAPAGAAAQNVYLYPEQSYGWGTDTTFTIAVGQTRRLYLYGYAPGGVSSYTITVFFDTNVVRVTRADSAPGYGLPSPTVTPFAEGVTLSATGTGYSSSAYLAYLTIEMKTTAPAGTTFSLRVDQWLTQAGAPVNPWTLQTDLLEACLARVMWGDPDSSLTVTGRDALIALTAAVQLPVTGFDLAAADVDGDGAVTSRDALGMLSRAIGGYYYYYYDRSGVPIAGRCAPAGAVPSAMAFLRGTAAGNLFRVGAGDSVAVPVGSPTAFYPSHFVRWSPDGTKLLGTAYVSTPYYYYDPIAVTLGSLVQDTLVRLTSYEGGGAYSPVDSRIAYFSSRQDPTSGLYPYLWLMDQAGGSQVRAQTTVTYIDYSNSNPAWSPNGQRVAFTGYQTCCTYGLWTVRVDSATVRLEYPLNSSVQPTHPSWSPAGDSLLFSANSRVYWKAVSDTLSAPQEAVYLSDGADWPSWTSAGITFRRTTYESNPATYDYYLRKPNGRIVRIFRAAGTSDVGASFR